MDTKIFGGVLLVVGTSIGAGMLALPIASAGGGFIYSTILLIACWIVMTFSAFLLLEVTLWLPPRTNMISMARATLGKPGEVIAWVSYLLLLYALLAAYISGGSAIFDVVASVLHVKFSAAIDAILFVVLFGLIVYKGIKPVDYVNRYLMFAKFGSFLLLILFAVPYLDHHKLAGGNALLLTPTVMVVMTSFGFAQLIPSLRSYFESDVKKLRLAILIGSLIPLGCYILWNLVILGAVPREGGKGLLQIMQAGGSVPALVQSLSYFLKNSLVTSVAHVFTMICVPTSFLSVSLGLSDFLADGLQIDKEGKNHWIIFALTFLPSLLIVLFYPSIFVKALSYAGIFAIVLLVLLPAFMILSGRYYKNLSVGCYQVMGGKTAVVLLVLAAFFIVGLGIVKLI